METTKKKRILIVGGTGFIGKNFINSYHKEYDIIIGSRSKNIAKELEDKVKFVYDWKHDSTQEYKVLQDLDVILNLSGQNIASFRWTKSKKKEVTSGRIHIIELLYRLIEEKKIKTKSFIQGSAIGYYGDQGKEELTEESGKGNGFLSDLTEAMETASEKLKQLNIEVTNLRTGIVLGKDGGAYPKIARSFQLGIGSCIGNGENYFPWIHIEDEIRAIDYIIKKNIRGIVNLTAAEPVKSNVFYNQLSNSMNKSGYKKIPPLLLYPVLGKQKVQEMFLYSQKVIPKKLKEHEFEFRYPSVDMAIKELEGNKSI
ncbi:MAG: TIGR01777 family oxidoreductase [Hyphomicrobiales bacterium]